MGRYESGSLGAQFKPHQVGPKALPKEAYGNATTPAQYVVQKTPWYVLVNNSGSYHFLYGTTGSIGGTITSGYALGIKNGGASGQPMRLDINPSAWSGSAGTVTGDVTFVYRGGL